MLTRADKEAIVTKIKTQLDKSQAVFLANLIGVPSNDANTIRKKIRDAKGKVVIARNTLLARAAAGTEFFRR